MPSSTTTTWRNIHQHNQISRFTIDVKQSKLRTQAAQIKFEFLICSHYAISM